MKSKKIAHEQQVEYPCLMESALTGAVVLFVDATTWIQVTQKEGPGDEELGRYSEHWYESNDSKIWKPFRGQIILEN